MFYINRKVLGIFLCGEKMLKYKEKKNRKIEKEIWCFTSTNNKEVSSILNFVWESVHEIRNHQTFLNHIFILFYPLLQTNIHAIQKMAENTILVLNISCILEHQQDKSFTEPISWGENMFGEKHSIHLQDQQSDPYHKYYRKKLSLIFNSLFFFFSFLKIFNLSHLNISIIIIIFP